MKTTLLLAIATLFILPTTHAETSLRKEAVMESVCDAKTHVKGHYRKTKSGKSTYVKGHTRRY